MLKKFIDNEKKQEKEDPGYKMNFDEAEITKKILEEMEDEKFSSEVRRSSISDS